MGIHDIKISHQSTRRTLAICGATAILCAPLLVNNSTHADTTVELSEQVRQCISAIENNADYTAKIAYELNADNLNKLLPGDYDWFPTSESHANENGWKENWQEYDGIRRTEFKKMQVARLSFEHTLGTACMDISPYNLAYAAEDYYPFQNSWTSEDFDDPDWRSKLVRNNFTVQLSSNFSDTSTIWEKTISFRLKTVEDSARNTYMQTFEAELENAKNDLDIYGARAIKAYLFMSLSSANYRPENIPALKEILAKYNQVSTSTFIGGLGDWFSSQWSGLCFYNDGIAYGCDRDIPVNIFQVLLVPDSLSKDSYANFLKNQYDVLFPEGITPTDNSLAPISEEQEYLESTEMQEFVRNLKTKLGTELVTAEKIYALSYTLDGSSKTQEILIALVSVPEDKYSTSIAQDKTSSTDYENDITITTNDSSVTPDAMLNAEDKKEDIKVKNQIKTGEKLLAAFDLSLFSKTLNRDIPSFVNGLTVCIPIDNEYSESTALARYIADNGTAPEEDIVARIVQKNSKKYAEFEVKHFSIYAILAATDTTQDAPNDDNQQDVPSDNTQEEPVEETPSDDQSDKDNDSPDFPQTGLSVQESISNAIVSTCGIIASIILVAAATGIIVKKYHKKA